MAGQKRVMRWLLTGLATAVLSGCVSVPDAIKGTSPTPQDDLVRVMSAPSLYVGQEARFGGKVVDIQNQQGKTRLEIASVPLDSAPVRYWASRRSGEFMRKLTASSIRLISVISWSQWLDRSPALRMVKSVTPLTNLW